MAEKNNIITIYDFELKTDTLYEVSEKFDASAPSGYKKYETSKALMEEIHNRENLATFNEFLKVWDTGLYKDSKMLKEAITNEDAREQALAKIQEYIIDPIEEMRGVGSLRSSSDNNEFWDSFQVPIYKNKVFNTSEPLQLLQLYILLLKKTLTPQELQSHPNFRNSQYCIVDKESLIDKENEKALRTTKAYGLYWGMKTTNKKDLIAVLNYLNMNVDENIVDSSLDLMFKRFIEHPKDGIYNIKDFIQVADDYKTKAGKDIINIYQKLKEMYANGIVELRGKEVYIDGEYIASSFKTAASVIAKDKALMKIFTSKLQ